MGCSKIRPVLLYDQAFGNGPFPLEKIPKDVLQTFESWPLSLLPPTPILSGKVKTALPAPASPAGCCREARLPARLFGTSLPHASSPCSPTLSSVDVSPRDTSSPFLRSLGAFQALPWASGSVPAVLSSCLPSRSLKHPGTPQVRALCPYSWGACERGHGGAWGNAASAAGSAVRVVFFTISHRTLEVFAGKMSPLLMAVSRTAHFPPAPQTMLLALCSAPVLPLLKPNFSSLFPFLPWVFTVYIPSFWAFPLHPHLVPHILMRCPLPCQSCLCFSGICRCGDEGGTGK